jgi:hypothetical protein
MAPENISNSQFLFKWICIVPIELIHNPKHVQIIFFFNSNITCSFEVYVSNRERRQVLEPKLPTPKPKEDSKNKLVANNPKERYKIFIFHNY